MDMTNLKQLHLSMMEQEIALQRFPAKVGATTFDCLFATGDKLRPFLALAAAGGGANTKVYRFEVKRGYKIDAYLGDSYHELRDLYFGRSKSSKKLQSKDFFEELHDRIPTQADPALAPEPADVARLLAPDGLSTL